MLLQVLGFIIASLIGVRILLLLYSAVRHHQISLRILGQRIEDAQTIAEALRLEHERAREVRDLSWNGYRKFEVRQKVYEDEARNTCSFYLVPHDGRPLTPFLPGQFLTCQFSLQSHEQQRQMKPIIRCYSLSDSPKSDGYRMTIKRVPPPRDKPDAPPGLVSNYLHDHVNEGDILDVKAPSGNFVLNMEGENPVVLVGGGVGMTPLLSMLSVITESGSKRETWFFYGVRNSSGHIMKDHLVRVAQENDNVHLHVCYSAPKDSDVHGKDYHHAERVSVELFKRLLPSNNYQFYVCGPPSMMDSIIEGLLEWGVPEDDIKFEAFGPASVKKGIADVPTTDTTITFSKSGLVCKWDASVASLLELAEANRIAIDAGCRVGNCNTCLVAIKEGDTDYVRPPDVMPEAGSCLTCISIPKGDLTLDA